MPQTTKRRSLASFDACSLMLFAALTMGGALAQANVRSAASGLPLGTSLKFASPQASGETAHERPHDRRAPAAAPRTRSPD